MYRQGQGEMLALASIQPEAFVLSFSIPRRLLRSGGKGYGVVRLGHHAPVCANASPCLHKQDTAEGIMLRVEPIEAVFARRVNAVKMRHASLEIVQLFTL
jgi:hypothetical protein